MSPERAGSPLEMEPRELALALQSAVPPFKLVRLHLPSDATILPQNMSKLDQQRILTIKRRNVNREQPSDDDLTNLTWLQNNNLLKGMNLVSGKSEQTQENKTAPSILITNRSTNRQTNEQTYQITTTAQSPTSDYMDESSEQNSISDSASNSSMNSPVPQNKESPHKFYSNYLNNISNQNNGKVTYDPKIHTFSKPPYSFSCLIFMAIEDSMKKALPVKEIYEWIMMHFPYFKTAPTGWKNSVRHNLSLNKCFKKVEKLPNLGKGSLWTVDSQYRPNLLQALTRAPFHPLANNAQNSTQETHGYHQPTSSVVVNVLQKPETASEPTKIFVSPFIKQLMIDNNNSQNKVRSSPQIILSKKQVYKIPPEEEVVYEEYENDTSRLSDDGNIQSDMDESSNCDDNTYKTDVDIAASAILALKHAGDQNYNQRCDNKVSVITSSPSQDRDSTYSSTSNYSTPVKRSQSPDEAFESDIDENCSPINLARTSITQKQLDDEEEQRRIKEGADALLNLAGVRTINEEIGFRIRPNHETTYIVYDNRDEDNKHETVKTFQHRDGLTTKTNIIFKDQQTYKRKISYDNDNIITKKPLYDPIYENSTDQRNSDGYTINGKNSDQRYRKNSDDYHQRRIDYRKNRDVDDFYDDGDYKMVINLSSASQNSSVD